ncbi:hypothetical protein RIF29_19108 [Crotalaria pallida]|uniref:Uncharacterized protein n=1 Tax=Crotalaria pallida TaxID=3830 RepID=A0AAN9F0Q2_CROPI
MTKTQRFKDESLFSIAVYSNSSSKSIEFEEPHLLRSSFVDSQILISRVFQLSSFSLHRQFLSFVLNRLLALIVGQLGKIVYGGGKELRIRYGLEKSQVVKCEREA